MSKQGPTDRALAGADHAEVRREYTARLSLRQAEGQQWERRSALLSAARLGVFLSGLLLAWLALRTHVVSAWWLITPAIVFAGLMVVHEVVLGRKRRAAAAAAYYQDGLDRLDHRWIGRGPSGDGFADPKHSFAADLDLFGDGSLFQLLCRARTSQGQETLARWLLQPASVKEALSRQEAVRELAATLDLREDLAVLGEGDSSKLRLQGLVDWQQARGLLQTRGVRALAVVLSILAVLFAFNGVSGEKERRTLAQVFSNSVPRSTLITAKMAAAFTLIAAAFLVGLLLGALTLAFQGFEPLFQLHQTLRKQMERAGEILGATADPE
jgi:hypothetical protein